jgi:hypothetical protein
MTSLIQKSLGSKEEFCIENDKLIIKSSNLNKSVEYSIRLDQIGFDIEKKRTKSVLLLIPFFIALSALEFYVLIDEYNKGTRFPELLIYIFGSIFFPILAVCSFFQKTETIFLTGGNKIVKLNALKPDKQTVDTFIDELHTSIRLFYKNRYAHVDALLSKETSIGNFRWLREIGAINEFEFEQLIAELNFNNLF